MASRFWAAGSSSEEEEDEEVSSSDSSSDDSSSSSGSSSSDDSSSSSDGSDSDSDSDSDDSDAKGKGARNFLVGSSSESDDDRRVVVKSAKDKAVEELRNCCDDIRNKMKINDWNQIQSLFDELNKRVDKAQKVAGGLGIPRVYVRILVELEDFLNQTLGDKDTRKKMSATNAKSLNTMRQRIKKHNASLAEEIAKFRAKPESSEEEPEDEESESDSSEDEEEGEGEGDEEKRPGAPKKKDKLLTMDPKEITFELVNRKLREIIMTRGRRGTDKHEQVEMLTYLTTVARGPAQRFEVLAQLVSSLFDLSPSVNGYMKVSLWKKCVNNLLEMLRILDEHRNIVVDESQDATEERGEEPAEGAEVKVWGNLVAFIEKLDDELFKSLQVIDPHTHEYMARLKDEVVYLALAQKVADYFQRSGDVKSLPKISLRLVEHFYYKTDRVYGAMRKLVLLQQDTQRQAASSQQEAEAAAATEGEVEGEAEEALEVGEERVEAKVPLDYVMAEDCHEVMKGLMAVIFRHGDERTKARAMMCNIFHRCIHDDFYTARDLLLMSHLQEQVQHMDISTQILYNRTMAQLGLAAFRAGLITEAHNCLAELYGSGHIKELLAQGMSMGKYQQEKTPEQELQEKRRQMPFHMHITLELVEAVYLISAMVLEVPNMAANPLNPKRKMVSKSFHRILDQYARQTFTGPPENVRDHIMAATKALMRGDWAKADGYLGALNMWNLMPQRDGVKAMLRTKLQEEALRTYLFAYSSHYNSLSLDQLCTMFELSEKKVYSIVSKMMIAEELQGSWDQPTRTIVMHNLEATRLQQLAMQFADKAATVVDLNERALALRSGGLRDNDDEGDRRHHRRQGGGHWEDGEGGQGRARGGARLGMVRNVGAMAGRGDRNERAPVRGTRVAGRGGGGGFRQGGGGGFGGGGFTRGYRQPQQNNMATLGSISRPGGGAGSGGYNRDRRQ